MADKVNDDQHITEKEQVTGSNKNEKKELPECFVIMPIADTEGYAPGHFRHVFYDIFAPACQKAGFKAVRADQVSETNMIHLDILQRLLETPMALCDLSSRNPNVLFELGLRQAFDKPVALVKEVGTPRIFDIEPLRYADYRKEMRYHEVLEDQDAIAKSLRATFEACKRGEGINSLVKLLSLTKPASYVEISEVDKDPMLQLIRAEIGSLRKDFISVLNSTQHSPMSSGGLTLWDTVSEFEVSLLHKVWPTLVKRAATALPRNSLSWFSQMKPVAFEHGIMLLHLSAQDIPPKTTENVIRNYIMNNISEVIDVQFAYTGIPSQ